MSPVDPSDIPPSVREVLAYFLNHPGAAGSLRDLAESRIAQEIAFHNIRQVTDAVEWLLERKFLVHKFDPILTLNTDMTGDAERLVSDLAPRQPSTERPGPRPVDSSPVVTDRAVLEEVESEPPAPAPTIESVPASAALGAACLEWINATLLRYYRKNRFTKDDHPGLSRDAATIERLLTPRDTGEPEGGIALAPGDDDRTLTQALAQADGRDRLIVVKRQCGLSALEFEAFLLCLAPEIDAKFQTIFGILNDDLHGRRRVTLGLLCRILGDPIDVRRALEQTGNLTRWRLLDHGATLPSAEEPLRPDPWVVAWLFGHESALTTDPAIASFVRRHPWAGATWLRSVEEGQLIDRLRGLLAAESEEPRIVLAGGEKNGSRAALEAAVDLAGVTPLRIVLPSQPPGEPIDTVGVSARIARAARLLDALPVLDSGTLAADALGTGGMTRLLTDLSSGTRPLVIITRDVERIVGALPRARGQFIQFELPLDAALPGVYAVAAQQAGLQIDNAEIEQLAQAYPMPLEGIENAIWLAVLNGAAGLPAREHFAALSTACRRVASPELPRFGRRIEPVFRLRDVVVSEKQQAQLAEIVTHVRHAPKVMHGWGFSEQLPYGRGVTALFSGPSGAGKTMAAQAIARELGTDAYVVDLSRVVSKYIGESEKNLDMVFAEAEHAGVVLCFDEADALFGKRSEIKDAHDRYANIEVAFLLQRMEAFAGLAILTTNFRQNLDTAFVRRIRFIIDFKKPDEQSREAIWRRCLVAPLAPNVNLRFLATRLELTGGTIQQIALRSAFAAAAAHSDVVDMSHIITAARAELLKLGLTSAERELEAFASAFQPAKEVA